MYNPLKSLYTPHVRGVVSAPQTLPVAKGFKMPDLSAIYQQASVNAAQVASLRTESGAPVESPGVDSNNSS